jgi:UDP-N-acetylglucosamine 2-epimerase (non-hydrolysing)/GDP/UDP-N,N'-diacetylbacillosamine 2-epimerase (hydrolysing)
MNNLFTSLDQFKDYKIVFTMPNSDFGGREICKMIKEYVIKNPDRSISFSSLGKVRYLNLLSM